MMRRMLAGWIAILSFASIAAAQDNVPHVVKYQATIDMVKYVYGSAAPVARLAPGDILETNTLDAFGDAIQ